MNMKQYIYLGYISICVPRILGIFEFVMRVALSGCFSGFDSNFKEKLNGVIQDL